MLFLGVLVIGGEISFLATRIKISYVEEIGDRPI